VSARSPGQRGGQENAARPTTEVVICSTVETVIEIRLHVDIPDELISTNGHRANSIRAAWQEPEIFTTDVRAAFRSLR
jgi:hypothetical protein